MSISAEDIARVRELTDTVAVISETTALKRVGTRWVGLCPFHVEKSGSFSVNAAEGLWHCFGCGAGGDVITFVQEIMHLGFADAVEVLAGRAGLTIRRVESVEDDARRRHRARLHGAVATAATWYHERLLQCADSSEARRYLRSRGYDAETVRRFNLGWAPRTCDLSHELALPEGLLVEAGLLRRSEKGTHPSLRSRVMFPVYDAAGRAVAFSGRLLPGVDGPKYVNTPETVLYSKRLVLYGLSWAKDAIVRAGAAVVCEGQTDVIAMHAAGMPNAVAPCGTALTGEHVALLRRFADRVVTCFDGDGAGLGASERLYGWEATHRVSFAVASLPMGVDPDELARTDPSALSAAVDGAIPLLAFRVRRLLDQSDLVTPEGRAAAARAAAALVAEHPDPLVRSSYLEEIARRCQTSPARLLSAVVPRGDASPAADPSPLADGPEAEMLRVAVQVPEAVPGWVAAAFFDHPVLRAAYDHLAASTTLHEAISRAGTDGAAVAIRRAAVEPTIADPAEVAARLVERAANRALRSLVRDAPRGADDAVRLAREVAWVRLATERLRVPADADEAAQALADWLRSARVDDPTEGALT